MMGRRLLRFEPLEARLCLSAAELFSHWTFDNEHIIGNVVLDASSVGGDQSGILTGGPPTNVGPTTGIAGVVGEAADFAGGANNLDNEFVDLGVHAETFGTLATGTISAWVKPEIIGNPGDGSPTDRLTIFSVSNSDAPSEEMTFAIDNGTNAGKLSYIVRDGTTLGNVTSSPSSDLFDGQWHHVAVTVGFGNATQIYIDGDPQGSAAVPFLNDLNVNASAMGRNRDSNAGFGQWFFGGKMDDVGLWDDALTAAEVKALVSLAEHVELNYDLSQAEQLFNLADVGSGSLIIQGQPWHAASALALSDPLGEIVQHGDGTLSMRLDDDGNGIRTPVSILVTNTDPSGPGSLRAAIDLANTQPEADLVRFDASLSGQTISLGGTELVITDALSVDAVGLSENPIIDAQHNSRIFDVNGGANDFDVTFAGLTLTSGKTTGNNSNASDHTFSGGAIRSLSTGDMTIEHSTITDSHITGLRTRGGGIFSRGDVTLTDSTLSGNSTEWHNGGGLYVLNGDATLTGSTVSGNYADVGGGGIVADNATLTDSTVSGNTGSIGGGIVAKIGMTLIRSTVSGNSARDFGGGIYIKGNGTLSGSLVADNTAAYGGPDLYTLGATVAAEYSLIGDGSGATITDNGGNQIGTSGDPIDPRLRPLAHNGGPTLTHALLPGSPAIDAGDPNVTSPRFDQRGVPYPRVTDGDGDFVARIDIGAVESLGLRNPSFEDGGGSLDAWAGFNSTGVSDSIALHGSHSARVSAHLNGFSGIYQSVPIQGGELLVASAQAWPDVPIGPGNFGELKLEFFSVFGGGDLLGQQIVFTADDATATGAWRQTTLVATAPVGAVEARLVATFVGSTSGEALHYDALSLREALVVDTLDDESDGDFSSGDLSLREAIETANAVNGFDLIVFDPSLSGGTIELSMGQLTIEDEVTIDATGLAAPLTIDAQQQLNTNIFNVTDGLNETTLDVAISGLTLTGGNMTSPFPNNIGGAIRNRENLTVTSSTISGNAAVSGGGIHTVYGSLTVINSTISGNSAQFGGGISSNPFTHMAGQRKTMIINSTVSGNTATIRGGGIYVSGGFNMISHSTITDNTAPPDRGSGIVSQGDGGTNAPLVQISSSIIAGNNDTDVDLVFGTMISFLSDGYNLVGIGNATGAFVEPGDQAGVTDPLLGPLADNGGPTLTHALLHGSPALDAGDPSIVFDPIEFDQRGLPRVADGGANGLRIDIGAYEAQAPPPVLPGDYNENGVVDAADYVLWRKMLGDTGVTPFSGADGNGDGDVTAADYSVWTTNFGDSLPPPSAGGGAAATAAVEAEFEAVADADPPVVYLPSESFSFAARNERPSFARTTAREPVINNRLLLVLAQRAEDDADEMSEAPPVRNETDDSAAADEVFAAIGDDIRAQVAPRFVIPKQPQF